MHSPLISKLLSSLSQLSPSPSTPHESVLGSALVASLASLAYSSTSGGGHIITFACTLPTLGHGALQPRGDESSLHDTDKESTLFLPRNAMWEEIASQAAEEGVGMSMFLGMGVNVDVGSIGACTFGFNFPALAIENNIFIPILKTIYTRIESCRESSIWHGRRPHLPPSIHAFSRHSGAQLTPQAPHHPSNGIQCLHAYSHLFRSSYFSHFRKFLVLSFRRYRFRYFGF